MEKKKNKADIVKPLPQVGEYLKEEKREKLIKALSICSKESCLMDAKDCPYNCYGDDCIMYLIKDAFQYISEAAE